MCVSLLRNWAGKTPHELSGRNWRLWIFQSRESWNCAPGAVPRRFQNPSHKRELYCVGSVESGIVYSAFSNRNLRPACLGGDVNRPEKPFAVQALPALMAYATLLRILAPACCLWWNSPFRECSTSKQQLKSCSCSGSHTVNYRDNLKWRETKDALEKLKAARGWCTQPSFRADGKSGEATLGSGASWDLVGNMSSVEAVFLKPLPQPIHNIVLGQSLKFLYGVKWWKSKYRGDWKVWYNFTKDNKQAAVT